MGLVSLGIEGVVDSLDEGSGDAVEGRGASISAGGGLNLEKVLLSLDRGSGEGDLKLKGSGVGVDLSGDGAVVDDLVGESAEGVLDGSGKVSDVSADELDRNSGEGLVHLGSEGESKGLAVKVRGSVTGKGLSS